MSKEKSKIISLDAERGKREKQKKVEERKKIFENVLKRIKHLLPSESPEDLPPNDVA